MCVWGHWTFPFSLLPTSGSGARLGLVKTNTVFHIKKKKSIQLRELVSPMTYMYSCNYFFFLIVLLHIKNHTWSNSSHILTFIVEAFVKKYNFSEQVFFFFLYKKRQQIWFDLFIYLAFWMLLLYFFFAFAFAFAFSAIIWDIFNDNLFQRWAHLKPWWKSG